MAAAKITPTLIEAVPNLGTRLVVVEIVKATQHDWVIFPSPVGFMHLNLPTGAAETYTYAVGAVDEEVTNVGASDTSFNYDGTTSGQLPASGADFWILVDKEIMKVTSYNATTMTVLRGRLGTKAANHTNDAVIYVLNTVKLGGSTTGIVRGLVGYLA